MRRHRHVRLVPPETEANDLLVLQTTAVLLEKRADAGQTVTLSAPLARRVASYLRRLLPTEAAPIEQPIPISEIVQ